MIANHRQSVPSHYGEMPNRRLRGQVEGWKSHQVGQDQLAHLASKRSDLWKSGKWWIDPVMAMFIGKMMINLYREITSNSKSRNLENFSSTVLHSYSQKVTLSNSVKLKLNLSHLRSSGSALRDRLVVWAHLLQVRRWTVERNSLGALECAGSMIRFIGGPHWLPLIDCAKDSSNFSLSNDLVLRPRGRSQSPWSCRQSPTSTAVYQHLPIVSDHHHLFSDRPKHQILLNCLGFFIHIHDIPIIIGWPILALTPPVFRDIGFTCQSSDPLWCPPVPPTLHPVIRTSHSPAVELQSSWRVPTRPGWPVYWKPPVDQWIGNHWSSPLSGHF